MLLHDLPKESRQRVDRLGLNDRVGHIYGQGNTRGKPSETTRPESWRDFYVAPCVDGETKVME